MKEIVFKIGDNDNAPLATKEFLMDIVSTSIEHKKQNRALAFAFIVYNFESPQVAKILEDNHYWDTLNRTASKYLSIYYIHSDAESLNQNSVVFSPSIDGKAFNLMHGFRKVGGPSDIKIPVLEKFFGIEEKINLPALVFFQIDDQSISDSIFIELKEKEIEKSFLEIKEAVSEAVNRLKHIDESNYQNSEEIFRELKTGLNKLNHKMVFKKIKNIVSINNIVKLLGL